MISCTKYIGKRFHFLKDLVYLNRYDRNGVRALESASNKVLRYILKKIEKKELKIGDKLPSERELASKLEVSRSSVREAISAMNIMGMVQIHPKGRTVLREFHLGQFINVLSGLLLMDENIHEQIQEFRLCIECEAAKLAAMRGNGSALRQIMTKMKNCTNKKRAEKLDVEFHQALAKASCNKLMIQASMAIMTLVEASVKYNRAILEKKYPNLEELINEHEQITQAIENKEAELAGALIKKHLQVTEERNQSEAVADC